MDTAPRRTTPSGLPTDAAVASERDRVVQTLSAHYAQDQLTLTEFEKRLEKAYHVSSADQLRSLIDDLPQASGVNLTDAIASAGPSLVPSSEVPPRAAILTIMGGQERSGSWIVPRQLRVFVLMGGVELDLREARFGPGVTDIEIIVVMGGVNVIVPPGVRVESIGTAFMGGFELAAGDATALSPANPVVRLSGLAIMGGVDSETRYPGESAKEAKRRRRRRRAGGPDHT